MHEEHVLARMSLGSAIRYTLKDWDRLTVFERDPPVYLDNNRTERGIRGAVRGPPKSLRLQVRPAGPSLPRRCTA